MNHFPINPFIESLDIKPLLGGDVVKHTDRTYRVEHWFGSIGGVVISCPVKGLWSQDNYSIQPERGHYYIFIDITMNTNQRKNPFKKKPSDVLKLIKENKLTITHRAY